MRALSSRTFCPCEGRQVGLLHLPARWRYTTLSLDEEQVDLIRFQQAFAAAANLIHVSQQLSDEVINMIR